MLELARKAVSRRDTTYIAGCLFRLAELCAHALHGHARQWLISEKGAIDAAGRLPEAPRDFTTRAHNILAQLGPTPTELAAAIEAATTLLHDVRTTCQPPD